MKSSVKAPMVYRALLALTSPLVFGYTLWRAIKDGGLLYLKQRFGFAVPATRASVWVHAASVGEINTVYPLLNELKKRHPSVQILVTTNTPTGKSALQAKEESFGHVYLPLDYSHSVRRFLLKNKIELGIIVETEIWPTLYGEINFPLCIVNGRLSAKSMRHNRGILYDSYRFATSQLDLILARSEADADSFEQLGVNAGKIEVIGNMKFAEPESPKKQISANNDAVPQFCLLASTHEDEEIQLARAWLSKNQRIPLVIAPRHPERSKSIQAQLRMLTTEFEVRSQGANLSTESSVYLADTLGEMQFWYSHAAAIFMGGSLVPKGGHNMLEAAQQGKSVVTGPHFHNFSDEVNLLLTAEAIEIVDSAEAAVIALLEAIAHPTDGRLSGQRAKELVLQHKEIQKHYADRLAKFSSVFSPPKNTHLEVGPS